MKGLSTMLQKSSNRVDRNFLPKLLRYSKHKINYSLAFLMSSVLPSIAICRLEEHHARVVREDETNMNFLFEIVLRTWISSTRSRIGTKKVIST